MTQEEPFDLDAVLTYLDGDKALFDELVQVFLKESRNQLIEIQAGIEKGDAKLVERAAHSIKGSTGTFSAKRASEVARHLEALGREGRLAEFPAAAAALEHELELLFAALIMALDADIPPSASG
jgi:two-component system, sensor histidine kinase and response regulator